MSYATELCSMIAVWALLGYGFLLPVVYTRMFLVCPAAICAIGAYGFALATGAQSPDNSAVNLVIVFSVVALTYTGSLVLLSGLWHDELVVGSFALQMLVVQALKAGRSVTGGDGGIGGFASVADVSGPLGYVPLLCAAIFSTVLFVVMYRRRSMYKLVMSSVGQDPFLSASSGIGLRAARTVTLAVAFLVALIGGALWAAIKTYISPDDFGLLTSVQVLTIVLVAQRVGPLLGPVAGACVVVGIPEAIRTSGAFTNAYAGHAEEIAFGCLLLLWGLSRSLGAGQRYRTAPRSIAPAAVGGA